MAEQEKRVPFPQLFSELGTPWYGAAKALTAWYIDTNEQLANAVCRRGALTAGPFVRLSPWLADS